MSDNDNTNIIILPVDTTLDLQLDRVLDAAQRANIEDAVVLGYYPDSSKLYFASTSADMAKVLTVMERARALIIRRLEAQEDR